MFRNLELASERTVSLNGDRANRGRVNANELEAEKGVHDEEGDGGMDIEVSEVLGVCIVEQDGCRNCVALCGIPFITLTLTSRPSSSLVFQPVLLFFCVAIFADQQPRATYLTSPEAFFRTF